MIRNVEARNILEELFNKWNGKSEEVINEANVEDVQTTIMAHQPKLYTLNFRKADKDSYGRIRYNVLFGDIYLCRCYEEDFEIVESDFNDLKYKRYSIAEIQNKLKDKYNRKYSERNFANNRGAISDKEYSFRKQKKSNRIELWYRFDELLELVCYIYPNQKQKSLKECRELISQDKSKEEIKKIMKQKYRASRWDNKSNKLSINPSCKVEAPIIPLSNYSWNDRGFLLKGEVNTHIVPADFNDIESVLANNGSTRSVTSLLPNCDYEALMDLSKYCKTEEYANLRREGIVIMNNR